ncbi:hypothetical protein S7711_06110 [Stachybotrys chartarum IBT 7711]|uniref:Peptidase S33 tripeptidyl aminopeptidase-like C-terminal domain-containing protein n=1 Tax=Stachybotrys chartarum (strain CBS 109288 / IBT 7711) TaxID=1280523 RepID=A0A084B8M5_STACB|nr:hypothetical protein S7711_06110 [Stachybotrys chartarum IBT 7711]KFA46166.1 hypothetical protein S40293_03739 [Stachybotrys chartarum IBT 40293]
MHAFLSVAWVLVAITVVHAAQCGRIQWGPCEAALTSLTNGTIECATLPVPLDYTQPNSSSVLNLELLRVPAATESQGSIILNFGGPGVVNRRTFAGAATDLPPLISLTHDLVTFDSRGTGNTLPFRCFESPEEQAQITAQEPDIWETLTLPTVWSNASNVEIGRRWAAGTAIAERCFEVSEDIGDLLGTAFVARDIMQVVEALDEDGMLRYWGQSYGTALGATVAAMFPDKIDRMVIDGVLNPREYFNTFEFERLASADSAFTAFFEGCVSRPDNCALVVSNVTNTTAEDLEHRVWDLIYHIRFNPIAFDGRLIDYQFLKFGILSSLYNQASFPALAAGFAALLAGDLAGFVRVWDPIIADFPGTANEQLAAIACSDRSARASSLEELMPVVERKYALSQVFGDLLPALDTVCAQWKFQAKERYEGTFEKETNFPILVIGNFADAQTPLVSAQNVSQGFSNSVLLQLNGVGHTSFAHISGCVINATLTYFENGTLPEPDTVCEPEAPLFAVPFTEASAVGATLKMH